MPERDAGDLVPLIYEDAGYKSGHLRGKTGDLVQQFYDCAARLQPGAKVYISTPQGLCILQAKTREWRLSQQRKELVINKSSERTPLPALKNIKSSLLQFATMGDARHDTKLLH